MSHVPKDHGLHLSQAYTKVEFLFFQFLLLSLRKEILVQIQAVGLGLPSLCVGARIWPSPDCTTLCSSPWAGPPMRLPTFCLPSAPFNPLLPPTALPEDPALAEPSQCGSGLPRLCVVIPGLVLLPAPAQHLYLQCIPTNICDCAGPTQATHVGSKALLNCTLKHTGSADHAGSRVLFCSCFKKPVCFKMWLNRNKWEVLR